MNDLAVIVFYAGASIVIFAASYIVTKLSNHVYYERETVEHDDLVENDTIDNYDYEADREQVRSIMYRVSALGKKIPDRPEPTQNPSTIERIITYDKSGRTHYPPSSSFEWWK